MNEHTQEVVRNPQEKWSPEEWNELGGCPDCGENKWQEGPLGSERIGFGP